MIPTDVLQPQKRRNICNTVSKAFYCHASGFWVVLSAKPHMRFQLMGTTAVIGTGCVFLISTREWGWVLLSIGLVLMSELIHTALKITLTRLVPTPLPTFKAAKNIATVGGSALIASLIFVPKFIGLSA